MRIILLLVLIGYINQGYAQLQTEWAIAFDSVNTFCSPGVADLNQDGIKDIVIGGGFEKKHTNLGIFAVDGYTGQLLWQNPAPSQIYTTPIFQDLTGDDIPEVFIAGRNAQFYALDGTDGSLVWEFWDATMGNPKDEGWYNFYLPKWTPDLNGDGIDDILTSNGGDATALSTQTNRPVGHLLLLSGYDGTIIAKAPMPDGKETYFSPMILDLDNDGELDIIFGSGGETIGGKLYKTTLQQLWLEDLTLAEVLLEDSCKGFIPVPSLADINRDNILDFIIPKFEEEIVVVDGATHEVVWRYQMEGFEVYVSPTIGYFTDDDIPDVGSFFMLGNFPFYWGCRQVVLDGKNGNLIWLDTCKTYHFNSPNAIDTDGDGLDELLMMRNYDGDTTLTGIHFNTQFAIVNPRTGDIDFLEHPNSGLASYATPLLTHLDDDENLDVIYSYNSNTTNWYAPEGFVLAKATLAIADDDISWAGYFGTNEDGTFLKNIIKKPNPRPTEALLFYPNPTKQVVNVIPKTGQDIEKVEVYNNLGQLILVKTENTSTVNLGNLKNGIYHLQVYMSDEIQSGKVLLMK